MQQGFVLFQFKVTLSSDTPLFGLAQKMSVIILMYFFTIMNFVLILLGLKPVRRTRFFSVDASVLLTTESSHFNGLSPIILLGTPFSS